MATRFRDKISLLMLLATLAVVVTAEWAIFRGIERQQGRAMATVIGGLLRDESTMSRAYLLAQSLEDLQTLSAVGCARLVQIAGGKTTVFYDSTYKPTCGGLVSVVLKGIDGNQWELQVQPILGFPFHLMKWLTLVVSVLLISGVHVIVHQTLEDERRRRAGAEMQKVLLEELASQVRHDVASPITALKFIADRAPLDPDTKEFFKQAVARTQGIFETLNHFKEGAESFSLRAEIDKIIAEKREVDPAFPVVANEVGDEWIKAPRIEFGRVLSNLIDNAKQAGASKVHLLTRQSEGKFTLIVDDNGQPVPEAVLSRLGERGNTSGKETGSGLGLYHCHQFLNSLGGRMVVLRQAPKVQLEFAASRVARMIAPTR